MESCLCWRTDCNHQLGLGCNDHVAVIAAQIVVNRVDRTLSFLVEPIDIGNTVRVCTSFVFSLNKIHAESMEILVKDNRRNCTVSIFGEKSVVTAVQKSSSIVCFIFYTRFFLDGIS